MKRNLRGVRWTVLAAAAAVGVVFLPAAQGRIKLITLPVRERGCWARDVVKQFLVCVQGRSGTLGDSGVIVMPSIVHRELYVTHSPEERYEEI